MLRRIGANIPVYYKFVAGVRDFGVIVIDFDVVCAVLIGRLCR